jgi:hypothetical protein
VPLVVEARKCLVNLVVLHTAFRAKITSASLDLLLRLKKESDAVLCFPLARLLFTCIEKEEIKPLIESGSLDILAEILENNLRSLDLPSMRDYTVEILKLVVKLTMHLGPLESPPNPEPTVTERRAWKQLAPLFQRIMQLSDEPEYRGIKRNCVACIVNTPRDCAEEFDMGIRTMDNLLSFLSAQLDDNDEVQLTPILMVLTTLAKAKSELRNYFKQYCFPHPPPADEKTEAQFVF